jgi:hypothetical protein
MRKFSLVICAILLSGIFILAGCSKEQLTTSSSTTPFTPTASSDSINAETGEFGIYLVDTGGLVLSDRDIQVYSPNTHTITLNQQGIERWNSFQTYSGIPKLAESLYGRDFVVKLEGEEMYRGEFYSGASSGSYAGVVILDSLFKLDNTHDTISIQFGYPTISDPTAQDPRDNPAILSYLEKRGLLQ